MSSDNETIKKAEIPKRASAPKTYPEPYGTKAQNNKGNKMQPAHQKKSSHKGR